MIKRGKLEIPVFLLVIAFFALVVLFFSEGGITGFAALSGSGACGATITQDTDLTSDLSRPIFFDSCLGNGLIIGADNIFLDCHGYTLPGQNTGYGVSVINRTNVTIKNCIISNFSEGIYFENTTNSLIYNNTLVNNTFDGAYLKSQSDNNTVLENNASSNKFGISSENSNDNNISDNFAMNNSEAGILLYGSNLTDVYYNILNSNGLTGTNYYSGIYLYLSNNNSVYHNNGTGNYEELFLDDSYHNTIFGNILNATVDYAIVLAGNIGSLVSPENNTIYNNHFISGPGGNGWDDNATKNFWNITKTAGTNIIGGSYLGGNYWSDYTGIDDGSGSAPYDVSGDTIGDTKIPYDSNTDLTGGGDYMPLTLITAPPLACGQNLSSSRTLTSSLTTSNQGCLNITADNIILDCRGYSISGDNLYGKGLKIDGRQNITIANCNITRFYTGVEFNNSNNTYLINSSVYGNTGAGTDLHVWNSKNFSIINSWIESYNLINASFSVENSNYGKVKFYNESITVNAGDFAEPLTGGPYFYQANAFNFSSNLIKVNATGLNTFNQSAELSFYGLSFTDPQPLVDFDNDGNFDVCSPSVCTELSYSGGTFVYNVTHFTDYSSNDTTAAPIPQPNLTISKTDTPDPVDNGTELNYTITIENIGAGNATNLTLYETYPSNISFVSANPPANVSDNIWYLGNLTNGSNIVVYITLQVNSNVTNNTNLTNLANVTYHNSTNSLLFSSVTTITTVNVPAVSALPSSPSSTGGGGGGSRIKHQCNDNKDNDNDSFVDYPDDLGCASLIDENETGLLCRQSWSCSGWSQCIDGQRSRSCNDLGQCQEKTSRREAEQIIKAVKPAESETCTVPPAVEQPQPVEPECTPTKDCSAGYGCISEKCILMPSPRKTSTTSLIILSLLILLLFGTFGGLMGARVWSVASGRKIDDLIKESINLLQQKNIPELHVKYNKMIKLYQHLRHKEKEIYFKKILELHKLIEGMTI